MQFWYTYAKEYKILPNHVYIKKKNLLIIAILLFIKIIIIKYFFSIKYVLILSENLSRNKYYEMVF